MLRLACLLLLLAAPAAGAQHAQHHAPAADRSAEERAVLAVIDTTFQAMAAKDSARFVAMADSGARLVLTRQQNGVTVARVIPVDVFAGSIARATNALEERVFNPEVRIEDGLATVWVDYDFYVDGRLDHCGKDAFQLVRRQQGWRIVNIADTQRREGCVAR